MLERDSAPSVHDDDDDPQFPEVEHQTSASYKTYHEGLARLEACREEVVAPLNRALDKMIETARRNSQPPAPSHS